MPSTSDQPRLADCMRVDARVVRQRGAPRGELLASVYLLAGSDLRARNRLKILRSAEALVKARVIPSFLAVVIDALDAQDLAATVSSVDARFPTLREPRARALVGVGESAVEALAQGLRHPALFGVVEAWDSAPHDPWLPCLFATLAAQPSTDTQRVFLSSATVASARAAPSVEIADALSRVHRPYALWLGSTASTADLSLAQLPAALRFALRSVPWPR